MGKSILATFFICSEQRLIFCAIQYNTCMSNMSTKFVLESRLVLKDHCKECHAIQIYQKFTSIDMALKLFKY